MGNQRSVVELVGCVGIVDRFDIDERPVAQAPLGQGDACARAGAAYATQQLLDQIDAVHAELVDDAVCNTRLAEEPGAPVRSGRRIADTRREHAPEHTFFEPAAREHDLVEKSMHEADLQIHAARCGGRCDAFGGSHAARHRLLQQDRLARLRGRHRDRLVRVVWRCHDHRLHVGTRERRLDIDAHVADSEALCNRLGLVARASDDDPDIGAAGRRQTGEVILGDEARAEHRHANWHFAWRRVRHRYALNRPGTFTRLLSTAATGSVNV